MQLDMLQDDLFSDLQDTEQSPSSSQSSASKSSPEKQSTVYKPIDIKAVKTADDQTDIPDKPEIHKETPKLVEQEIPSTATLLDEAPADSNPIGSVLPVLSHTPEKTSRASKKVPVLESAQGDDDSQVDVEALLEGDDMQDDLYSDDELLDDAEMDAVDDAEVLDNNGKAPGAFKTISEAAGFLGVPQHVLRFWESRFSQIKPLKMRGGRRYYRPEDMEVLSTIQHLLYKQGYTIKGAKKVFSTRNREALETAQRETAATKPVVIKKVVEKVIEKPTMDERKKKQLSTIRNELLGLRETLSVYLA
jgi:DNA-binding transcriptional MerR regulator